MDYKDWKKGFAKLMIGRSKCRIRIYIVRTSRGGLDANLFWEDLKVLDGIQIFGPWIG